jgi:hypothetical protein
VTVVAGRMLGLTELPEVVASVSRRVDAGVDSDIRGLVTAGRTVRLEWTAGLIFERHRALRCKVIAHSALAGHCQAAAVTTRGRFGHL